MDNKRNKNVGLFLNYNKKWYIYFIDYNITEINGNAYKDILFITC